MNRRQFLTRAIASVPAIAVGAEVLELLAPTRSIFLPPRGGWWGIHSRVREPPYKLDRHEYFTIFDNSYVGVDMGRPGGDYTAISYMQRGADGIVVYPYPHIGDFEPDSVIVLRRA